MPAKLLLGEPIARRLLNKLKQGRPKAKLKLVVVQIGANPVSKVYINEKKKVAKQLGVGFRVAQLSSSVSQEKAEEAVETIGKDKSVSGIIVQLPLPKHLEAQGILSRIPLKKDVDVLSPMALGLFALEKFPVLPPTVAAISLLLREHGIGLERKRVALIGMGRLVGLPLSLWILQQGAILSVTTSATKNLASLTLKADIIISATGKKGLVTGSIVKKRVVVIDAGTSVESGKTRGDVDFMSVSKKASFITPVPGGVGPLTVACLLQNLLTLNRHKP